MHQTNLPIGDWKAKLPLTTCRGCAALMLWARRKSNGATQPMDPKAPIFVMRKPEGPTSPEVELVGEFLSQVDSIRLTDGTELRGEDVKFFVSHFSTCPKSDRFTGTNRRRS